MNILFYLSRFPGWGGIESVTEMVGNRLFELGHQLSILTHVQQERPSQLIRNVRYYLMPDTGQWDSVNNREYVVRVMNDVRPEIIVYQDSYANTEGVLAAMKCVAGAGKIVVFEHNSPQYAKKMLALSKNALLPLEVYRRLYSRPKQIREDRSRHSALLRMCDKYVLLSKAYIGELIDVCGLDPQDALIKKICYINNPILPVKDVKTEKENIILFVGQINRQKRVEVMLDIWDKYFSDCKDDWVFDVVGDGPNREEMFTRLINKRILRVNLCGYQIPSDYYRRAKIFWMTSAFEGWPMTLLEAMQQGCIPVVMDTFASIRDIIDDNINGFIISADNQEIFASKTKQLMDDELLRERMSNAARKKSEQFLVGKIVDNWISLFDKL